MNTEQKKEYSPISGNQEDSKIYSAQNTLKQLQTVLSLGTTEPVKDVLLRAEEVLNREAKNQSVDPKARKILEDLSQLIDSAKQLEKQKDLGDRLQRIADETKKALEETSLPGASSQSREATQQAILYAQKVRPLFQLLMSSREFRVLIVDSLEIFRRIFLRHSEEPAESAKQQFLEGQPTSLIAQDTAIRSADTFKDNQGQVRVKISEEEWKTVQDDITRTLAKVAQHPTYQQGIENLLELSDIVRDQVRLSRDQAKQAVKTEPHAQNAQEETKELIASFSGREALDGFIENFNRVVDRVDQDERSRRFLSEARELLLSTKSSEYVQTEEFKQRTSKLTEEARNIAEEYKYDDEVERFLDSAEEVMRNIRNDEYVEVLRRQAGLIADDLSYVDNSGNVQLDMDTLGKIKQVIIPILAESLKYLPIPRIESSDKNRDFWVDNIVLCGYDVLPDHIRVQLESDSDVSIRDVETKYSYTKLIITLGQIRTELKNLDFYYKKKTFPEMEDSGRMTIRLSGTRGATLKIIFRIEQSPEDKLPKFQEGSASFDIEKFDLTFEKGTINHSVLLPIISSLFSAQIKNLIETEVEQSLGNLFGSLGDQMSQALSTVNRPLLSGLEQLRKVGKSNEFSQIYEKRQQKLE